MVRTVVETFQAHETPVGDFSVLRALPQPTRRHIGPFVFLDHFGPTVVKEGPGIPAHPHAGIEVITYLFEGEQVHRDSLGNESRVSAGGAQWITAGRGVVHAEKPDVGSTIHGVQIWASLPRAMKHTEPRYQGFQSNEIPMAWNARYNIRLLCGNSPFSSGGPAGPITLAQAAFLAHFRAFVPMRVGVPENFEMAVYQLSGQLDILSSGDFIELPIGEFILLGGEPAEEPLLFSGPFVMDTPERLQQAHRDFQAGRMGTLDGVPY